MQASMSWSFTTDARRARRAGENVRIREGRLLGPVLGQPLLAPALGFALLVLSLQARLLVEPAALELPEQALARQLFLGDLQGLLDVIVKNLNFHPVAPAFLLDNGSQSSTEARGRARASLALVARAGLRCFTRGAAGSSPGSPSPGRRFPCPGGRSDVPGCPSGGTGGTRHTQGRTPRPRSVCTQTRNTGTSPGRPPGGGRRQGCDRTGRHDQPSARSVTGYTHKDKPPSRRGGDRKSVV